MRVCVCLYGFQLLSGERGRHLKMPVILRLCLTYDFLNAGNHKHMFSSHLPHHVFILLLLLLFNVCLQMKCQTDWCRIAHTLTLMCLYVRECASFKTSAVSGKM